MTTENQDHVESRILSERFATQKSREQLGLLADLAGSWEGSGFNLIARPNFHDKTDLYLQLNQTREHLKFEPIGGAVPNRGFGQDDINLYGLTYLQKISDASSGAALHIEPGIWTTQPNTTFPPQDVPTGSQLVARLGSIPHGNALLAEGIAEHFSGAPVLTVPGTQYQFSKFPSFNSTPFGVPPTAPGILINAAGSSEALTAPTVPAPPFPQYDLSVPIGAIPSGPRNPPFSLNTRTPYPQATPPLPATIQGIALQDIVNDPIRLLQQDVQRLLDEGYTFEGTALNIATEANIEFLTLPNSGAKGASTTVAIPQFGGGTENIQFLLGEQSAKPQENAQTALVYATFWIEKVSHPEHGLSFLQLQYAQMVVLNFPVFHLLHQAPFTYVNLGWPHISVATLRKNFG